MSRHAHWLIIIVLLIVTGLPIKAAHATATQTVEIVAVVHCEEHPTTVCGFANITELRRFLRRRLSWTNELFRPNQISFRLNVVHVIEDDDKFEFPGCRDHNAQFRADLAANWAQGDPHRLYWFAFQQATGGCCAIFPWSSGATNAIYCLMSAGRPNLAHEYGHSFCLPHTFKEIKVGGEWTRWDPVNGSGDHNGDGISDTLPDPGALEEGTDPQRHDSNSGLAFANHDWCVRNDFPADPNSVGPDWCTLDCTRTDSQGTEGTLAVGDDVSISRNIMSYWGGCRGPYTRGGIRTEGTSVLQRQAIDNCAIAYPTYRTYTDFCPAGDFDHDGWCNGEDNCPYLYSFDLDDADSDTVGDDCDNCPNDSNLGQENLDGDGEGDVCDADDDGDGCCDPDHPSCLPQDADQHPDDSHVPVGYIKYIGCASGSTTKVRTAFEGEDSDSDGLLDCQDDDDDDDGVLDKDDPCPIHPGIDPNLCLEHRPCNDPWPEICMPFCGDGLFVRMWSVINPDPTRVMIWDQVAVFDDKLHLGTSLGTPFSEQMGAFLGGSAQVANAVGLTTNAFVPTEMLRMELRSGDPFGRSILVKLLSEFEALTPDVLGDTRMGRTLIVELGPEGLRVHPSWSLGMPKKGNHNLPDTDGDGVPDVADNCLKTPNPFQADRDRDGFGDKCDPDFDQDGLVKEKELSAVVECLGVDLAFTYPGESNEHPEDFPPHDPAVAKAIVRCENHDLNGDRKIDESDVELARALVGGPPGPSGLVQFRDSDKDGVADLNDICPGYPDNLDKDGDGTPDGCDRCPDDKAKVEPGDCGCGTPDKDSDSDGALDCKEDCPADAEKTDPGVCGCGVADIDEDGNGVIDCLLPEELALKSKKLHRKVRRLRKLLPWASKKKKKKQKALKLKIRNGLNALLTVMGTAEGQVQLADNSLTISEHSVKINKSVKKALRTRSMKFARYKKRALRALKKFQAAL